MMAKTRAQGSATTTGPMDQETRQRIWAHILAMIGLGLLPVLRLGQLKENPDIAVTTAVLFLGAAWHIWCQARHAPPALPARRMWVIGAILALTGWQLAWVRAADFWFVRLSLVLISVAWVVAWWGVAGWIRGWRVLAAFGLWAGWCNGLHERLGFGAMTGWLSLRTAEAAGWVLWQCGLRVAVHDNVLILAQGSVSVGRPCTAIPLVLLYGMLLVLAALLLRLRWTWVALLSGLMVPLAFVLSVIRAALLALLVTDQARFQYWHGPAGGGWFTAAGMLVLAWAIGKAGPGWPEIRGPEPAAPLSPAVRYLGLPIVLAGVAGWLVAAPPVASWEAAAQPPVWPGSRVVADAILPADADEASLTDSFAWRRRVIYAVPATTNQIEVQLAYVPVLLTGDPHLFDPAIPLLTSFGHWRLRPAPGGGELWEGQEGARRIWVATLPVVGPPIAVRRDWQTRVHENTFDPVRWWAWWTHRQTLREKRAFWLAVSWQGPETAAGPELALAFTTWLGYIRGEAPASHPVDS